MAVLAANYEHMRIVGGPEAMLRQYPLAAAYASIIYKGALTCINTTTGYLEKNTQTAGQKFAGIAYESANNTNSASAAGSTFDLLQARNWTSDTKQNVCRVWVTGSFVMPLASAAITDVGKMVWCGADDALLALTGVSDTDLYVGSVLGVYTTNMAIVQLRHDFNATE